MVKQISLRLPDELHKQLKAAAERNVRSLHAEIIWRLREMEPAREKGQNPEQAGETR
ncbi:MAG TPA: Arc family DNA-binding protein [Mycobacterium sp.]|jgi:hypothetical protein|uniref:Arc family DNA-binding protein n=1 Tax=Mycobacterium sp. TaxID=1785 RepID=UPI002F3E7FEA